MIRHARAEDRAQIVALVAAMGGHDDVAARASPLTTLPALIASPAVRAIVAERDGAVVGVAIVSVRDAPLDDRREAMLTTLAVAPDARGTGIGRALLAAVDAAARELGCAAIAVTSATWRERAHAFYARNGYESRLPAERFVRVVPSVPTDLDGRFLDAAARAATRVAFAIAGRASAPAVGIGADGAPTEDADDAAERVALEELLPLGVPIVSEEAGLIGAPAVDPAQPWLSLDPLDGSRNFRAGFPYYAFSVALVVAGRPRAAFVADLVSGARYVARAGYGATRDGERIATRHGSVAAVSSPWPGRPFAGIPAGYARLRIGGSIASDCCHVADGAFGAFVSLDRATAHGHDFSAGWLVVEEAGGAVLGSDGEPPCLVPDASAAYAFVAASDLEHARALVAQSSR